MTSARLDADGGSPRHTKRALANPTSVAGRREPNGAWRACGLGVASAEHETEGVSNGIEEDAKAGLASSWDPAGSEREHGRLGLVDVVHSNVKVKLLGVVRVRPAWWDPSQSALEGEASLVRCRSDDDPGAVFDVFVGLVAEDGCVEPGELARFRAVDDSLLEAADHVEVTSAECARANADV